MKYRIAVLLTCFNRRDKTISSLKAMYNSYQSVSEKIELVVFLVDDGSTDNTSEFVLMNFPSTNVIMGDGNLFWNRGMIRAWEEAAKQDFDFYIWLNDDTMIELEGIKAIWTDSESLGHKSIIVGACKSTIGENVTYSGYLKTNRKRIMPQGKPVKCDFFNGNFVLIPRSIFKKVGVLDKSFHHSLGDIDYGLRAQNEGFSSYISSYFVAICDRHIEQPKWCDPKYSFKERLLFFKNPLAKKPREVFLFERRHAGMLNAIYHCFAIYVRLIFPKMVNFLNSKID